MYIGFRTALFILLCTIGATACAKCNAQQANSCQVHNGQDVLSDYSIEQIRQAIHERSLKTLYSYSPSALDTVSDRDLVNHLLQREKTIYPHDIRQDFFQFAFNPNYLRSSNSIAALIRPRNYQLSADGVTLIYKNLKDEQGLCSDQSFIAQPSVAYCTGFVIGANLIATAGHCVSDDWRAVRIVFGYELVQGPSGNTSLRTIHADDVYAIRQVRVSRVDDDGEDFAILETDRKIQGHPPLPLRTSGVIQPHEGVYTLGFPSGIPMKLADGAFVRSVFASQGYFRADLDTYGGNSGSPVINATTQVVEGILVRGGVDYVPDGECRKALVCPTINSCMGEDVTLISALASSNPAPGTLSGKPTASLQAKSLDRESLVPLTSSDLKQLSVRGSVAPSRLGPPFFTVELSIDGPSDILDRIKQVKYFFPDVVPPYTKYHPNPKIGANRANGFRISFIGNGCVESVTPIIDSGIRTTSPITLQDFNLCSIWPLGQDAARSN